MKRERSAKGRDPSRLQRLARMRAVADAYLRRPAAPPRWVVLAGEDGGAVDGVRHGLQRAASGIGVPLISMDVEREGLDVELGHDLHTPVLLYHHGEVDESQLSRLPAPAGEEPGPDGPDLLLWVLPACASIRLRSLYLLSMWSWALAPRHLRCLWPESGPSSPELLVRARASLRSGMHHAGVGRTAELLPWPEAGRGAARESLLGQLLQSLLAAPHREARSPSPPGPHETVRRRERGGVLGLLLLLVFCLVGEGSAQTPAADLLTVEFEGVKAGATAGDDENATGAWLVGRSFSLFLRAGSGVWNADGTVLSVQTRRSELYLRRDGETVAPGADTSWRFSDALVLSAPEFRFVMRQGEASLSGGVLHLRPQIEGPMFPGRQGLLLTAGMAVVILFLFMRANNMRRRLDQPRQRLRRASRADPDARG